MEIILWALTFALKLVGIAVAFMVFKEVLKNGTGTFRTIVSTIGLCIQAGCLKVKSLLVNMIKKERENPEGPNEPDDPTKVEAHVV